MSFYLTQGNKEDTTTLHVLGLLKDLLSAFPLNSVKSCCETLLRVMTLSHVVGEQFNSYFCHFYLISIDFPFSTPASDSLKLVTANAMQAFHKLFISKPSPSSMSAELNAQIITVSVTIYKRMHINSKHIVLDLIFDF